MDPWLLATELAPLMNEALSPFAESLAVLLFLTCGFNENPLVNKTVTMAPGRISMMG